MAAPRRTHMSSTTGVTSADRRVARDLMSLLGDRQARDRFELRGKDGRVAALSPPMLSLIEQAAKMVAQGTAVDVLARDHELTSQEAAALLGVSRQFLVRLLDRGDIPCTLTGKHRRVRAADLADYRERRNAMRREGLARLAEQVQEGGAYAEPATLGPARTRQG